MSREIGALAEPSAVAVDRAGAIYVCEKLGHRVSVFDRDGGLLRRFGRFGHGDGELDRPAGIAVGDDGRVYVADTGNDRIEVFDPDGRFERQWGGHGTAPGELDGPLGLAITPDRLFVADTHNNRVQVFRLDGTLLFYVWSYGYLEGAFDRPVSVAADAEGAFFVGDEGNSRIQAFGRDGRFERAFGGRGARGALLLEPGGIDFRNGVLTVADAGADRIVAFDRSGALLDEWQIDTELAGASSVASLPSGDTLVVCSELADRCRILQAGDLSAARWSEPTRIAGRGYLLGESGDTLLVASRQTGRPFLVDAGHSPPVFLGFVGGPGREPLELMRPGGFILDSRDDTLLVGDSGNLRIQRLRLARDPLDKHRYASSRARYVNGISLDDQERLDIDPSGWELTPATIEPGAIVRDARGRILVADTKGRRIVALDDGFHLLAAWGGYGDSDGRFRSLDALVASPDGSRLFTLDETRRRVQAFDLDGHLLAAWGPERTHSGAWEAPAGIAAARDGSLFVVDRGAGRVMRFDSRGKELGSWGAAGSFTGSLRKPESVYVDAHGRVLVCDSGNRRLQAFTPEGRALWKMPLDPTKLEAEAARRP